MNWKADGTRIFDGEGNLIASMWEVQTPDDQEDGESWLDMRHRTHAEREAKEAAQVPRALLMAAAPELLAALLEARAELEKFALDDSGESYNNPAMNDVIAKATGGAA